MQLLEHREKIFFVSGLSGAGKSQVLKFLEDIGYFCVDNLPPLVLDKFLSVIENSSLRERKIAIGIDIRSSEFFDEFRKILVYLKEKETEYSLIFMDASEEVLVKRFSETRREHPLTGSGTLLSKIHRERSMMEDFKVRADVVLDTSETSVKELWERLHQMFCEEAEDSFYLNILSFGYKFGIPISADLVFDVRFIPNPFYIPELGSLNGNDPRVLEHVLSHKVTRKFIKLVQTLILTLIPYYKKEGKNSLEIAFGCTGGQHRSVAIANYLKKLLSGRYHVKLYHRQLEEDFHEKGNDKHN
ncbi:MAG: RNase adapter RapZ [Candidatus Wallbacteria bacterium]|nr:RNase adapter RapZ [Candidatus Wallbacteria bacterium]